MAALTGSFAATTSVTPVTVFNQDVPLGMEDFGHDGNLDIGDRSHDAPSHSNQFPGHLSPPEPSVRGSTSTDGDRDGSSDDLELEGADLKALVAFEGDTGSCNPHKFKPYTSDDQLGKGSYGIVFMVECELCGNLYARKIISFRGYNKQQRERFKRTTNAELNCYRTLSHPHVLKYVHHELTENCMDIFTEYCERRDLDGFMGEYNECHYGMSASEGHGLVREYLCFESNWEPVLHRDIKPANVLLAVRRNKGKDVATEPLDSLYEEPEDEILIPKLGDFGTCYKLEREGKNPSSHCVGTRAFWAPEIRREGSDVKVEGRITSWSEKSDMWGVGGVLYGMLTMHTPGESYPRSLEERKSALAKALPEGHDLLLLQILSDCLDPEPSTRVTALHVLPATLKASDSTDALVRSGSFWKALANAPSSVPIKSIVTHFVSRYLPILAQDKTHFGPSEVCYLMGLVVQHAPLQVSQCYQYLAAGFQVPPLQGGTIFHAFAFLPLKDRDAARYALDESKWVTSQVLSHLLLQQNRNGLFPSAIAMCRGNIELSARLTKIEETARRQRDARNTELAVAKAKKEASSFFADEFETMFSFMASRMTSSLSLPRAEAADILITASENKFGNVVKKLIDFGIQPSVCGRRGETALHIFAHFGDLDMVRHLVRKGAAVDARDKTGCTPLHWAAWKGQEQIVVELVASKADVNAQDRDGRTPLFGAAGGGFTDVVRCLVRAKADVEARGGKSKETPLERARKRGHVEIVEILGGRK
ncbi:kinase-like domain-containing protein [Podospora didyma]|uniref:Kinase-like domain-containing protein n=1 Tax=Podospora didyma TaxID=330526 RepID=A0AAE0U429_9PEZI|nr:kinase-like domain-containing protein [Podospora didyma]